MMNRWILKIVALLLFFISVSLFSLWFYRTDTGKNVFTYFKIKWAFNEINRIKKYTGEYPKRFNAGFDAWGKEIQYFTNGDKICLASSGPDRITNTNDDIIIGTPISIRQELYKKREKIPKPDFGEKEKKKEIKIFETKFDVSHPTEVYLTSIKYFETNPFLNIIFIANTNISDIEITLRSESLSSLLISTHIPSYSPITKVPLILNLPIKVSTTSVSEIKKIKAPRDDNMRIRVSYKTSDKNSIFERNIKVLLHPYGEIDPKNLMMIASLVPEKSDEEFIEFSNGILGLFQKYNLASSEIKLAGIFYYYLKAFHGVSKEQKNNYLTSPYEILSLNISTITPVERTILFSSLMESQNINTYIICINTYSGVGFELTKNPECGYDYKRDVKSETIDFFSKLTRNIIDMIPFPIGREHLKDLAASKFDKYKYSIPNLLRSVCSSFIHEKNKINIDLTNINKFLAYAVDDGKKLIREDTTIVDIKKAKNAGYKSLGNIFSYRLPEPEPKLMLKKIKDASFIKSGIKDIEIILNSEAF